ncbi:MAG TPA: AAA family ATPase [Nitrososphaeraceae archaeon]|nr:AAA family ATPase [Nitrososphaeraceae archaeon]
MSDDLLNNIFDDAVKGKSLIKNRKILTIDYVPEKLQFRDEETMTIAQTLSVALKGSRPSNLLLFGKPGTGKTAVIKNVIRKFTEKSFSLGIEVIVPFVNAKLASTAYKVLYEIAEEMRINQIEKRNQVYFTGLSLGEATNRILDFIQKRKLHVIFVIDEIDSLVDKNGDDILYNFTRANEQFQDSGFITLIGISNSLTFKDKLDPRVRSSLSEEEIVFNPYKIIQLQKILSERVKLAFSDDVVTDGAINLCAAIAGKDNGDARKAIDLLRVAAEIAEREKDSKIDEKYIRLAQNKIEKDTNFEVVKNSTTHTKIVLLAITKSKNGNTGEVYEIYSKYCKTIDNEPLSQRRITQIISELDQLGLINTNIVNQGRYGRSQKIKISISTDTLKEALKEDPLFLTFMHILD